MLARGALCRLAVDAPKTSPHDLPQLARFLRRTLLARNASHSPAVRALSRAYTQALSSYRSYATTAPATKPTATVKRAVKAQAAKKAAPKRTTAAATSKRKPATKKAAAKKPAAKKKAAKKKPAPKRRVKKQLTPELEAKAKIAELKKKALKEPVAPSAVTGFNAYIADMSSGDNKANSADGARSRLAEAAKNWKNLTPAEHEHYNHIANEKTAARRAEYKAWIESHTPDQIREANNARVLLRRRFRQAGTTLKRQSYPAHTAKLVDERHIKKPGSSYLFFSKERWASGDFKNIKPVDASKLIGNEWKALSAGEKQKYVDEFAANRDLIASDKATASS